MSSAAARSTNARLDSAGKRAAFAAFYAPLHFLTMRAIVQELVVADSTPVTHIDTIVDLGCGTGVAGGRWRSRTAGAEARGCRPASLGGR
jgi:hypothetical protein